MPMPTLKKRINVTLPTQLAAIVEAISRHNEVPLSRTIVDLLQKAVEVDEDMICSRIAEQRLRAMKGTISSEKFWSLARPA